MSSSTLWQTVQKMASVLPGSNPMQEAKFFLQDLLNLSTVQWIDALHLPFPKERQQQLETAMQMRCQQHMPFSRWLGWRTFLDQKFFLNAWTLDPRPESEGLILLLTQLLQTPPSRILDLGTGTGCLILSLLLHYPNATGIGVDQEEQVFHAAQENALSLGLGHRVMWAHSNWCAHVNGTFDCIVSNPPYIDSAEILPLEVAKWDPPTALFADHKGLAAYQTLIPQVPKHLHPGGLFALEIGNQQALDVKNLLYPFFSTIHIFQDLSGKDRYVVARL